MKKINYNALEIMFIIDMNNGFCNEGALADKKIKHIIPNIINLASQVLKRDGELFFVTDRHTKDSVELKRYAIHCENKYESQTVRELDCLKKDTAYEFYKNSTCALFAPGMMEMLYKMKNLKKVVLAGCCSDICILNFAIALRCFFDELNMDVDIVVPQEAIETFHIPGVHERSEANNLAYRMLESNGIKLQRTI